MSPNAAILAVCTALFALRVFGQVIVVWRAPAWLPANEHWYSGLMPYRYLLPSQLALFAVMAWITTDVARDAGLFAAEWWSAAALWLSILAGVYFASMPVRYVATMWLRPELRWLRRTIPIWFHMVLAVALWAFADFHRL